MQDENTLGTRAAPLQSAHSSGNPKFGPWMVVSRKGKFKSNKEREAVRDLVQNQYGKFEGGSRFSLLASGTEMEKGTKSTNDTPIANVNSMNDSETNMPASQFSHQAKSTRKFPSKKPAKPTNKNNSIALNNKPLDRECKSTKPNQPKIFITEPSKIFIMEKGMFGIALILN